MWADGDNKTRRESASKRRKTILVFDEDEDTRLVGFAAWRIRREQDVDGVSQNVGEVRFMGVVPDRQRGGIGTHLLANALHVMFHENGSDDLIVRIDVDTENVDARTAYEHWGFERYRSFVSGGKPYETLLLRPEPEADVGSSKEPNSGSQPSDPERD